MIPCYICGRDASTGWTKGFTPAPDSQKYALCPEHDTADNRLIVIKKWQDMLSQDIQAMTSVAQHKAAAPSIRMATVRFTGGGMLSLPCLSCAPTSQGTLRLVMPDDSQTFIPMQHIREYSLRPCYPVKEPEEKVSVPTAPLPPMIPES